MENLFLQQESIQKELSDVKQALHDLQQASLLAKKVKVEKPKPFSGDHK